MDDDELVNVRYMVDDVERRSRSTRTCSASGCYVPPAGVRRCEAGHLRLLLSGPRSSAGRAMPDGRTPGPGGWNRIHFVVADLDGGGVTASARGARFRNDVVVGPGGPDPDRGSRRQRRGAVPARRSLSRATRPVPRPKARDASSSHPSLVTVARQWGRIGCTGFGGPPAHIALLRELCVERRHWLTPAKFEDDIAACNLLPGPASTQLAILSAWQVAGPAGAIVGGTAFIAPGLVLILALATLFVAGSPPTWVLGATAGTGAAVAAVAVRAGADLISPAMAHATSRQRFAFCTRCSVPRPRRRSARGSCSYWSAAVSPRFSVPARADRRILVPLPGRSSLPPPPAPRAAWRRWHGSRSRWGRFPMAAVS